MLSPHLEPGPLTVPEFAEHETAMAVHELLSATRSLSDLTASQTKRYLVCREANDIELAYIRLGRMLSQLRKLQNAETSYAA